MTKRFFFFFFLRTSPLPPGIKKRFNLHWTSVHMQRHRHRIHGPTHTRTYVCMSRYTSSSLTRGPGQRSSYACLSTPGVSARLLGIGEDERREGESLIRLLIIRKERRYGSCARKASFRHFKKKRKKKKRRKKLDHQFRGHRFRKKRGREEDEHERKKKRRKRRFSFPPQKIGSFLPWTLRMVMRGRRRRKTSNKFLKETTRTRKREREKKMLTSGTETQQGEEKKTKKRPLFLSPS